MKDSTGADPSAAARLLVGVRFPYVDARSRRLAGSDPRSSAIAAGRKHPSLSLRHRITAPRKR